LEVRKLGLIIAETGRAAGNCRQERTLLQQTAKMIATYLSEDRANARSRVWNRDISRRNRSGLRCAMLQPGGAPDKTYSLNNLAEIAVTGLIGGV
jgi:hypothetical protein